MNLFDVADFYINRIVTSEAKSKASVLDSSRVKALLLDKNTTSTISMCATQSDLLNHNIYLIDTIENKNRDTMRHVKCIVYVKPSDDTIEYLLEELQNPRYADYYIYFSNTVNKSQLERLAESDDMEAVSKVEEIFQDYQILGEDLFSLEIPSKTLFRNQLLWDEIGLESCSNSLFSLLLSLKLKPEIVYENNSKLSARLAKEVSKKISENEKSLFDFPRKDSPPLLILLDRMNDPVTPLLQPWTYQSMIKEYIGVTRNIVDLSSIPDIDKDLEKVTLSSKQDQFYNETMFLNFGELGDKVKQYVETYKRKTQSNSQINSIEDIKSFIEKYPEFRKLSGNVAKHMAIVGELDRQLQAKDIWELSELEQNLSVHDDNQEDYSTLLKLLDYPDEKLSPYYKVKLVTLYIVRHGEKHPQKVEEIINKLKFSGVPIEDVNFLHYFFSTMNARNSTNVDLLSGTNNETQHKEREDILSELAKKFNNRMGRRDANRKSGNIADNVYMQHVPDLSDLLSDLSKNKLRANTRYKYFNANGNKGHHMAPPQDVIIFFVGGATFEEARLVHEFNETMKSNHGNIRLILGGSNMVSTKDFIDSMRK
ncbi:hypothetical protein Kpol_1002p76 [Vanderwaltozyma polyspora DSM 70294]|uniref:Vacuolar protein sorting-associated protein 45 n=1 Tax=Vanderwaltozyma polyspora (strain ATCC 22028 / DSM 70294 / BCRC 21397 / CBS 2163 / NBRC 10782 / NRRL Y-8283 / UCD 57-17) TaxID=436907 RepID=A7TEA7_VANPO|nr:uncharacterized protein Kpol_1002p76 [Vanderwaltozyma polyspora DSM 70294]EDO19429.1 hypothetical protein Kpol_1002p76 [Vanderwaltozyma polyspora DSM 70294]